MKLSERFNEDVVLDFDFVSTARLKLYDDEREERLLEAASGGLLAKALSGPAPPKKTMKEGTF